MVQNDCSIVAHSVPTAKSGAARRCVLLSTFQHNQLCVPQCRLTGDQKKKTTQLKKGTMMASTPFSCFILSVQIISVANRKDLTVPNLLC